MPTVGSHRGELPLLLLTFLKIHSLECQKCQQAMFMAAISISINSSCLCVSEHNIQHISVNLMYDPLNRIRADK